MRTLLLLSLSLALAACGSEQTTSNDTSKDMTAPQDMREGADQDRADMGADLSAPADMRQADDGAPGDLGADQAEDMVQDMTPVDMAQDMANIEMGEPDMSADMAQDMSAQADADMQGKPDMALACDYLDLDISIVDCAAGHLYLRRWSDINQTRGCAEYFTIGQDPTQFPSQAEATNAASCDTSCQWRASTSVTFLHCGRRNGYIVYRDGTPGCEAIYEFSDGLYPGLEDWKMANPCPN